MALTVGDRADREILYRMLGSSVGGTASGNPGDTLTLRLFKAAPVLGKGDSKSRFVAASGAGYAYIPLAPASWTISTLNPGTGDTNMASYAQQTFTFTGADSISGYYLQMVRARTSAGTAPTAPVAGVSDSILMWAEKFVEE
jgi:hypothetical protein